MCIFPAERVAGCFEIVLEGPDRSCTILRCRGRRRFRIWECHIWKETSAGRRGGGFQVDIWESFCKNVVVYFCLIYMLLPCHCVHGPSTEQTNLGRTTNGSRNWDDYITINHHVLGAKSQKLLGIACDIWFLLRYIWVDLPTFTVRTLPTPTSSHANIVIHSIVLVMYTIHTFPSPCRRAFPLFAR